MTRKVAFEKMMDLDAEVSVEKTMVALVFEIDGGGIHMAMTLMNQDTTVLLQIVLGSEIRYLGTIVFPLVPRLVDVVIEDEYPWILYQKFGQLC